MFKGKKGVYILVPLNIVIWGFCIYRFYSAYNDYDTPIVTDKLNTVKLGELKDSIAYKLSLNYKDPFLKDVEKQSNSNEGSHNTTKQKQPEKVSVVKTPTATLKQLPEIKYFGLIKNSTSGVATALVALNGQSKHIKVNDVIDGITFKSFNKDSLVAKWGKETIVARK